jgi:DNA-directed RNA polymerase sigma subunit (sigma70/sigma32)
VSLTKRDQDGQQRAELKKLCIFFQIMRENRRLTFRRIAQQVNIDRETDRKILTEGLEMRKVCAKIVPKDLLTRHCLFGSF